ncbi:MAG: hypothetical protein K9J79_05835 [Desulfobacteraceae bacterium]|nr:hypothetical protein [Desulfobacteraceae bacterium]
MAILICYAAIGIILSGFRDFVDQGAPPEVCEQINRSFKKLLFREGSDVLDT